VQSTIRVTQADTSCAYLFDMCDITRRGLCNQQLVLEQDWSPARHGLRTQYLCRDVVVCEIGTVQANLVCVHTRLLHLCVLMCMCT